METTKLNVTTTDEHIKELRSARFSKATMEDLAFFLALQIKERRRFSTLDGTVRNLRASGKVWSEDDIDRAVEYGRMMALNDLGVEICEWGK